MSDNRGFAALTPANQELRPLSVEEIPAMVEIVKNAYPSMSLHIPSKWAEMEEWALETQRLSDDECYYGLFRNRELVGTMGFHDFRMNVRSQIVDAGGVGLVAVDLMHKKEGAAKELIGRFIRHYRDKGVPLTLLYAFRPDFYYRMGFGHGPQMHEYRIPPNQFPKGDTKAHIRLLKTDEADMLRDFDFARFEQTHGFTQRSRRTMEGMLKRSGWRVAAYVDEGRVHGYAWFKFRKAHPENGGLNDLVIHDLAYDSPQALSELFTFLHSQLDQVHRVVLYTLDTDFYHLFPDPRNGTDNAYPFVYHETSGSAVGLMYRIVDTELFFRSLGEQSFAGETCRVKFNIKDTFLPEHTGALVDFRNGYPAVEQDDNDYDVEVTMDVAPFSSMAMGAVSLHKLIKYGLATVSDAAYVERINRMFYTPEPPCCMTEF